MTDQVIPEAVVVVTESFEGLAVERWSRLIGEAVTLRPQRLIVDLAGSPLIDAAAIGVLLQAHRDMVSNGGRLALRAPSARVRHILRLARLDGVFSLADHQANESRDTQIATDENMGAGPIGPAAHDFAVATSSNQTAPTLAPDLR